MEKYKSYSSGLLGNLFGIILAVFFINYIIFQNTTNKFIITVSVLFGLLAIIIYLLFIRKNTCSIEFKETNVFVYYKYLKKKKTIDYINIYELKYIDLNNSGLYASTTNRIGLKYFDNQNKSEIIFESINDKNYLNFVKWIKSKNKKIKFSVSSSDSIMNDKLQEKFGWNYRK